MLVLLQQDIVLRIKQREQRARAILKGNGGHC